MYMYMYICMCVYIYIYVCQQERLAGAVVPAGLLDGLLKELEALKWPANTHRYKVQNPPDLLVQQKISDPAALVLGMCPLQKLVRPASEQDKL